MKISATVNLNRIPANYNIADDFAIAQAYHAKHGVDWNYTFKNVDVHGYTSVLTDTAASKRWLVMGADKLITIDPNANVNMFVFDENEWATNPGSPYPLLSNTPNGCAYLYAGRPFAEIGTYTTEHANGQVAIEIAHEQMHCNVKLANLAGFNVPDVMDTYRINDLTDNPNSNFVEQWKLLAPYLAHMNTQTYKHFTMGESTGSNGHTFGELDAGFRLLLDTMRDQCGFVWVITSGKRSVAQNASLSDSVGDSAHLLGLAADIACNDSTQRKKIDDVAKANGITRIGIGKGFVHLDISKTLPQNIMWTYY